MAKEGLAYCIKLRTEGPEIPAGPRDILNEFLEFCLKGIRKGGKPVTHPTTGLEMAGTINWLASLGKFKAKFYVAHKPALMFFVSLDEGPTDWRDNPGFMYFVRNGNLTVNLGLDGVLISEGEFILEAKTDFDKALADMERPLARVSRKNKPGLIAALRGDKETNLKQVIDNLESEEAIGLRDLIDEREKAFDAQLAVQAKAQKKPKRK
ncbi:MAG TPA: hypothetical protein VN937_18695 [Blastocatellia bacterium]|nr:hypothetical protein [Blastocatellia bacterium]